jgi:hypothetical protein
VDHQSPFRVVKTGSVPPAGQATPVKQVGAEDDSFSAYEREILPHFNCERSSPQIA